MPTFEERQEEWHPHKARCAAEVRAKDEGRRGHEQTRTSQRTFQCDSVTV